MGRSGPSTLWGYKLGGRGDQRVQLGSRCRRQSCWRPLMVDPTPSSRTGWSWRNDCRPASGRPGRRAPAGSTAGHGLRLDRSAGRGHDGDRSQRRDALVDAVDGRASVIAPVNGVAGVAGVWTAPHEQGFVEAIDGSAVRRESPVTSSGCTWTRPSLRWCCGSRRRPRSKHSGESPLLSPPGVRARLSLFGFS